MVSKTPAMVLQELCIKKGTLPTYNMIHQVDGSHSNEFMYEVEAFGIISSGKGRSKKDAKQETARNVLVLLMECGIYDGTDKINLKEIDDMQLKPVYNNVGTLGDACLLYRLPPPEYRLISAVGPPHAMEFTFECHLGSSLVTKTTSTTKKMAKQIVAKDMLEKLKILGPEVIEECDDKTKFNTVSDSSAIEIFKDLSILKKINLGLKIRNYDSNLNDVLEDRGLNYSDIKELLNEPHTEESLSSFCELMGFTYKYEDVSCHKNLFCSILTISSEFPLSAIGLNIDRQIAKDFALNKVFLYIKTFFQKIETAK